jgi:gliding motility-associated-like protein
MQIFYKIMKMKYLRKTSTDSYLFFNALPCLNKIQSSMYFSLKMVSILSLITCCTTYMHGQSPFYLNGSAIASNDSCYQLTSDVNWQVGSIWNGEKVNLNESFLVAVNLFLGCKDEDGADGIVFGLQPLSTSIGTAGGDMGFGDVEPSLGVEFDNFQNVDYDDPTFDHIAIIRDGITQHNIPGGTLAGPVQSNLNDPNIEDCEFHYMEVGWDAEMQTLSVYLDCELRLTYTGDIVNDIFDGDPLVFWGFTSATGGSNNIQEVCFSYTTFLNELVDQTICPGTEIQLEAIGGTSYLWSPSEGLSDPNIADPIASPTETTLYTLEVLDDCGNAFYDEVLITVENDQFELEIINSLGNISEVPLGTESTLSAIVVPDDGENYTYLWSSTLGSISSDISNSSVTSTPDQTGTETITVEVMAENGCLEEASFSFEVVGVYYAIPNVFTPNGDDFNDVFKVYHIDVGVTVSSLSVFNRWGQKVFVSSNNNAWDGTYKGEPAQSDVYIYQAVIEINGDLIEESGEITLLR